jgi:quercetin 2,3-dioxygenase
MIEIRKSQERGYADHGWLKSYHSFSFADYYDPKFMAFGALRVINEDRVAAGMGFGTHGHRDMEIISYVLDGALAHQDSMGNGSTIRPGDVQRMSAGTGVQHSEFNHSREATTHFLQIWIEPNVKGIAPSYEEKHFDAAAKQGRIKLIASSDGREGSVTIHADASLYATLMADGDRLLHRLAPGRRGYVHVARGSVTVNGNNLVAGDALKVAGGGTDYSEIELEHARDAEVLLFDLA